MEKYRIVANDLIYKIKQDIYEIGSKLPSETVLASDYDVSRETIRLSLKYLSTRGYIQTRHGSGSYVISGSRNSSLDIVSFSSEDLDDNLKRKVISLEIVESNSELENIFKLPSTTKYIKWERLRYITNPIQLEQTFTPIDLVPKLNKKILESSWYNYIEKTTHQEIDHSLKTISAVKLPEREANLLGVKEGYPSTLVYNISYLKNGTIFELSINYHINHHLKYFSKNHDKN